MEGVIVKELMPHNVPNVRVKFVAFTPSPPGFNHIAFMI